MGCSGEREAREKQTARMMGARRKLPHACERSHGIIFTTCALPRQHLDNFVCNRGLWLWRRAKYGAMATEHLLCVGVTLSWYMSLSSSPLCVIDASRVQVTGEQS